ncbi:MAG: META domain-containing protein [Planctomicrobium sp.]|jgi:uncharacterized protein GlcG (DUF336 family)|nr:META domain-containing protein [Planctomicrobium sp.]
MSFCKFVVHSTLLLCLCSKVIAETPQAEASRLVLRNRVQLTLAGAELVLAHAKDKAVEMRVKVNISVVDDGGHLLAFARMDGARPGSIYTSMTKATTAATKRGETGPLPNETAINTHLSLAVENAATASGGKFTTLKGGVPIIVDGQIIGAIGVCGATGEQDAEVAKAGAAALIKKEVSRLIQLKDLIGTWLVEDIDRRGVIDFAQTRLEFQGDGNIAGHTGVSPYSSFGKFEEGEFQVSQILPPSMRAAAPALMDQETRLLKALPKVKHLEIDNRGLLFFIDAQGEKIIRASLLNAPQK